MLPPPLCGRKIQNEAENDEIEAQHTLQSTTCLHAVVAQSPKCGGAGNCMWWVARTNGKVCEACFTKFSKGASICHVEWRNLHWKVLFQWERGLHFVHIWLYFDVISHLSNLNEHETKY